MSTSPLPLLMPRKPAWSTASSTSSRTNCALPNSPAAAERERAMAQRDMAQREMAAKGDMSAEERLIARCFGPLATHPGALGLTDDAAVLTPPPGCDLVLTTDGVIAGVHFFQDDPPETIGRKVLRMNLSDLAAKGAEPAGFVMSVSLPAGLDESWIAGFAAGLAATPSITIVRCWAAIPIARPDRCRSRSRRSASCRKARWCGAPRQNRAIL